MKALLRCESKKYRSYFLFATVAFTLIYALVLVWNGKQAAQTNANLWVAYVGLIALAFVNPVVVYSFKTSGRGAVGHYALPIRRRTLFAVKTIVGLFLTLVPFTVAYFFGVLVSFCRMYTAYNLGWYFVGYPWFLVLGACLFGINAFAFTRANRLFDGVLFMLAYAMLDVLLVLYAERLTYSSLYGWWDESFSVVRGIVAFGNSIEDLLIGKAQATLRWWVFFYPLVIGGVCYTLLHCTAERERAETAGGLSEGKLGYPFLIPTYTALCIGSLPFSLLSLILIAAAAFAVTVVYRRKVLFSWKYWLLLVVGIVAGVALFLLVRLFAPPLGNPPNLV